LIVVAREGSPTPDHIRQYVPRVPVPAEFIAFKIIGFDRPAT
jgi:hypothetical protein